MPETRPDLSFNGLSVLYEIARRLSAGGQLDSIMADVLKILEASAGMRRGMISILNVQATELAVDVAHGIARSGMMSGRYRIGEGITGHVAMTGKPFALSRTKNEPLFLNKTGARDAKESDFAFLCVPIKLSEKVVGVLSADRVAVETPQTLEKELQFLEAVADLIAQVVDQRRVQGERINALETENWELRRILETRGRPEGMIGNSGSIREVYRLIAQIAPQTTTVLIRGQTGTGKELVARAIHVKSAYRNGPFVAVNCAALTESLIESELFGHEKGAFTDAVVSRPGKFELAHNGTLFLDEIGELSPREQGRLLRVIESKEVQHVGGHQTIRLNVRLIAATNRDLEEDVAGGRFREDLFYRINGFTISLPPLHERGADLFLLADHFVRKYARGHQKSIKRFSTPAIEKLSSYTWPGNVRELENVIERAVLVAEGEVIEDHDLPEFLNQVGGDAKDRRRQGKFDFLVGTYEKELIIDALKDTHGNQAKAAQLLKITNRIIQYKVKRYHIDYKQFRGSTNSNQ